MDHPNLDDFIDGTLPRRVRRSVEHHLRGCDRCRHEVESIRSLRTRTSKLPRAMEPERDLWPGVQSRTGQVFRRRRAITPAPRVLLRPAWAFAFTASMCVLFFLISPWSQMPLSVVRGVACEGASRGPEAPAETYAPLDHRVDARSTVSRHAAMVDEAIDQLLAALREDPGNSGLARLLRREYQRKASLVRTTAQLLHEIEAGVDGSTS